MPGRAIFRYFLAILDINRSEGEGGALYIIHHTGLLLRPPYFFVRTRSHRDIPGKRRKVGLSKGDAYALITHIPIHELFGVSD